MTIRVEVDVRGRRVVLCGAAPAALGGITALLREGAELTVIATEVPTTVRDLAERSLVTWVPREFTAADLTDAALVGAAFGDTERNAAVHAAAASQGTAVVHLGDAVAAPATTTGRVTLVGGGPGDPGLLTVAGLAAVQVADVVVCDRLAPLAVLEQVKSGAEIIDVGKIPRGEFTSQERINQLLVEHARRGRHVVRLKGGDNFVFGRGGEEWEACAAAGIAVDIIPGVSSAVGGPALAGIPLTHRQLTQGFTVVSGHLAPGHPGSTLNWGALARANTTLVILMGVATLAATTAELIAQGLPPTTAAAVIADAGLPSMSTVRGTVADLAQRTSDAGIVPPAVIVIGAVAAFRVSDPD